MPVEPKAVFQSVVFHPATVNPKLQAHLGLTLESAFLTSMLALYFNMFHI
jgi:hypothetical protein